MLIDLESEHIRGHAITYLSRNNVALPKGNTWILQSAVDKTFCSAKRLAFETSRTTTDQHLETYFHKHFFQRNPHEVSSWEVKHLGSSPFRQHLSGFARTSLINLAYSSSNEICSNGSVLTEPYSIFASLDLHLLRFLAKCNCYV